MFSQTTNLNTRYYSILESGTQAFQSSFDKCTVNEQRSKTLALIDAKSFLASHSVHPRNQNVTFNSNGVNFIKILCTQIPFMQGHVGENELFHQELAMLRSQSNKQLLASAVV